jgi:hypothetical protein
MFKLFTCVVGILLAASNSASAQFVRFAGGGYVTAATGQCLSFISLTKPVIQPGMFVMGSYLPANIGDNGPSGNVTYTALPQVVQPFGVNLKAAAAFPTSAFANVSGTMVSVMAATHTARARLILSPATVTATTPSVKAELRIQNANGRADCDVTDRPNPSRCAADLVAASGAPE